MKIRKVTVFFTRFNILCSNESQVTQLARILHRLLCICLFVCSGHRQSRSRKVSILARQVQKGNKLSTRTSLSTSTEERLVKGRQPCLMGVVMSVCVCVCDCSCGSVVLNIAKSLPRK